MPGSKSTKSLGPNLQQHEVLKKVNSWEFPGGLWGFPATAPGFSLLKGQRLHGQKKERRKERNSCPWKVEGNRFFEEGSDMPSVTWRSFYGSTQMNQRGKDTSQKDQHHHLQESVPSEQSEWHNQRRSSAVQKIKGARSDRAGRNNKKSKMTPPYVINRVFWQDGGGKSFVNSVHKVKGTVLQIQYRLVFFFFFGFLLKSL